MEFVSTAEALQWAVGNGTELIVIDQDLDLCGAPVATDKFSTAVFTVTDTVAIQVRLVYVPELRVQRLWPCSALAVVTVPPSHLKRTLHKIDQCGVQRSCLSHSSTP